MNLHTAFDRRDELNMKMAQLLLQGLQDQRDQYIQAIRNYPADRMAKYGQPHLIKIEDKIRTIKSLIDQKFSNS